MTLTLPDVLIAVVLFTCVPLQLFLVQEWGNSESSRTYAVNRLINNFSRYKDEYLTFLSWKKWAFQVLEKYGLSSLPKENDLDDVGESPAVEVMKFKQKEGYFGSSPEPRTERSPNMKFRIGQVVSHKIWNYRGVIIGWDETAKAPEIWLEKMHGKENQRWKAMPNYSILVDIRDRLTPQMTYVPEENIEVLKNTRIVHPLVDDHFESFDGAQYIPRPWLKSLYPQD